MQQIPDHPDIRAIERTGYAQSRPPVFTTCDWCGEDIHYGDDYFEIHGEILCDVCVSDCHKTA